MTPTRRHPPTTKSGSRRAGQHQQRRPRPVDGISAAELALLAAAAFAAGAVNAVAGGGSLISFPALVAVGVPTLAANVTNQIALLPGYVGGTLAYRDELRGQRQRVVALGVTGGDGGVGWRVSAPILSSPLFP